LTLPTATRYYTDEQLEELKHASLPRHIAIIPDGNRRWAKEQLTNVMEGHRQGGNKLIETVKAAKEIGIRTVTFYVFSTENWARPQTEVAALMWLLESFLDEQRAEMAADGIHFHTVGMLDPFPENVRHAVEKTKEATAACDCVDLIFALNYGSRDEVRRACQKIALQCVEGRLAVEDISEETIQANLDTQPWGDPDLFIRTSGEQRLSNFLLWQLSYAELYMTPVLWPDFQPQHLREAVRSFQMRHRRLGG
jgi:undecaprenyl diphosphate synthase